MKTQNLVLRFLVTFTIGVAFILMVTMLFSSCKNDASEAPGTLQLKAGSQNQGLKSASITSVNGSILLNAATVEIKNLRVEENSGNDIQNGDQSADANDNEKEKSSKSENNEGGDLMLSGPYLLDILNGSASIDQVTVQPGTYKKVDFDFFAGPENSNHSIELSGIFTNAQGIAIPFTLTSEFAETVQLPLAGNGVQVSSGGLSTISILFDVNNWLGKLDLNTATPDNGHISITKDKNTGLYIAFLSELSKHIEIDN